VDSLSFCFSPKDAMNATIRRTPTAAPAIHILLFLPSASEEEC